MNRSNVVKVSSILQIISNEIGDVEDLLLLFEKSIRMSEQPISCIQNFQNFDLALQLLRDLEHLVCTLENHLPDDLLTDGRLPLEGLLLGRIRTQFQNKDEVRVSSEDTKNINTIDLF